MLAKDIPEIKHAFLASSANSTYREIIFRNKFKYDLQIAYAEYGRFLSMYERDIDINSTDLIIEGSGFIHRLQLKSILENFDDLDSIGRYESPTSSWKISSILVKPEFEKLDLLPELKKYNIDFDIIEPEDVPFGYGGSAILQRIHYSPDDSIEVRYSIFNSAILYMAASDRYKTNFFGEGTCEKRKSEVRDFFKNLIECREKYLTINKSWFVDLDNENIRFIGAMGIPIPEAPLGLWHYLNAFNMENCSESYFRLQCIFTGEIIYDH